MAPLSSPASQSNASVANKLNKGTRNRSQDVENHRPAKRSKCPGVRVVGCRIYDSQNGQTCHQCRQKTMDFVAPCKLIKGNKLCTIKFCHKCLLNRYGEKAEEVALLDDWKCPKCRNICNCSVCMKKRGHKPTGILVHTAKATGFSSVSDMLHLDDPNNLSLVMKVQYSGLLPKKSTSPLKESAVVSPRKVGKENSFDGKTDANLTNAIPISDIKNEKKTKRKGLKEIGTGYEVDGKEAKQERLKEIGNDNRDYGAQATRIIPQNPKVTKNASKSVVDRNGKEDCALSETKSPKKRVFDDVSLCPPTPVKHEDESEQKDGGKQQVAVVSNALKDDKLHVELPLPEGTILKTVSGIEFSPEDVGHVLQFLEFCQAFGKVLSVKKVQAEAILRELRLGKRETRQYQSSSVLFFIKLLSLIQEDMEEESSSPCGKKLWFEDLKEFISESECVSKELSSICDAKEYECLDFSKKLKLLNFLCDEMLGTTKLRSWIDDENAKVIQKDKEAKEKVVAAKSKEKTLKQQLKDRIAKAIMTKKGALTISEHQAIISRIKTKADQAHAEMLVATDAVPKRKQRSDAVRTEPILLDAEGRAFWKLRCLGAEEDTLLQDMGSGSEDIPAEKWFLFNPDQEEYLEKYISSLRYGRNINR